MHSIKQPNSVITEKSNEYMFNALSTEYKFNTLSIEELFNHYKQVGFIYPEKLRRIAPHFSDVRKNWKAAISGGRELFCLVSATDSQKCHLATLTFWRSTHNGWVVQHLTSTGSPLLVRTILLGTQSHGLGQEQYLTAQNWFQPTNKYANRIFGSITKTLSKSYAAVNNYQYLAVKINPNTCSRAYSVCRVDGDATPLLAFAVKIRGEMYAFAEELDKPDIELDELNDLYKSVNLHRKRRCWLAYLPGRSEPIAGIIAYSGPLGLNFSFLENRCDLLCDSTLKDDIRLEICMRLIHKAAIFQETLPLRYLPITTDDHTAKVLISAGANLIRLYNQSIWCRKAFSSWLQHVERIFRRIEKRYVDQNICK